MNKLLDKKEREERDLAFRLSQMIWGHERDWREFSVSASLESTTMNWDLERLKSQMKEDKETIKGLLKSAVEKGYSNWPIVEANYEKYIGKPIPEVKHVS